MCDVLIIGGGIGGLSAAHHLARAGATRIRVLEAEPVVGGKARAQHVEDRQHAGTEFFGEHGFRFFPHFYRHISGTMAETMNASGQNIWDAHVVPATEAGIAYRGHLVPVVRPQQPTDPRDFIRNVWTFLNAPNLNKRDLVRYAGVMFRFATSCDERREKEYDPQSWSKFARADSFGSDFRKIFMNSSRNLSAMRADESSARTIGLIAMQLMFDFANPPRKTDALLNGPTNTYWLDPWKADLESRGVQFITGVAATKLQLDRQARALTGIEAGGQLYTADEYVLAVPLEQACELLEPEIMDVDPGLRGMLELRRTAVGNMSGLQFFLKQPLPLVRGHINYPESEFALTSISQAQFWNPPPHQQPTGSPRAQDILSTIISDWDTKTSNGKTAKEFPDEYTLAEEVWEQLKVALGNAIPSLWTQAAHAFHLDEGITLGPNLGDFENRTPLLIHPKDQLRKRPDAEREVRNLTLAADYVRTYTDLASMEGADEAARRAVRTILSRCDGLPAAPQVPEIYPLSEGNALRLLKMQDKFLFDLGLDHILEPSSDARSGLEGVLDSLASTKEFMANPAVGVARGVIGALHKAGLAQTGIDGAEDEEALFTFVDELAELTNEDGLR